MITTTIVLVALALLAAVAGFGGFSAGIATLGKLTCAVLVLLAGAAYFMGRRTRA